MVHIETDAVYLATGFRIAAGGRLEQVLEAGLLDTVFVAYIETDAVCLASGFRIAAE